MTTPNRILFIIALLIVAIVSVACGGDTATATPDSATSNDTPASQPATPEAVARIWFNALFMGDTTTLRANTCASQQVNLNDEVVAALEAGLVGDAIINTDNVTFTVANGIVTIGGAMNITMTIQGQTASNDVPMADFPLNNFPIIEEDGAWKVCADLVGMF